MILKKNIILIFFLIHTSTNLLSQSSTPNYISFKENSWTSFAVFDTINDKLKQIGNLKYDVNYNNIILKSFDNKDDTIKKVKDPFSLNQLLFEVESKSNKFYVIYLDSLKLRKMVVSRNRYIEYYTPRKIFLKSTFFIYTKNTYNMRFTVCLMSLP